MIKWRYYFQESSKSNKKNSLENATPVLPIKKKYLLYENTILKKIYCLLWSLFLFLLAKISLCKCESPGLQFCAEKKEKHIRTSSIFKVTGYVTSVWFSLQMRSTWKYFVWKPSWNCLLCYIILYFLIYLK